MKTVNLISINDFCTHYNIEVSFLGSLQQTGLIDIKTIKQTDYINAEQLGQLEKIICLYYELDINIEGIETITHLLQRIDVMQHEIIALRNQLRIYE